MDTLQYLYIKYRNNFIKIPNDITFTNNICNHGNINYIIQDIINNASNSIKIFENETDFNKFKTNFIDYMEKQNIIVQNSEDLFFLFRYYYNYIYTHINF